MKKRYLIMNYVSDSYWPALGYTFLTRKPKRGRLIGQGRFAEYRVESVDGIYVYVYPIWD